MLYVILQFWNTKFSKCFFMYFYFSLHRQTCFPPNSSKEIKKCFFPGATVSLNEIICKSINWEGNSRWWFHNIYNVVEQKLINKFCCLSFLFLLFWKKLNIKIFLKKSHNERHFVRIDKIIYLISPLKISGIPILTIHYDFGGFCFWVALISSF